MAQPNQSEHGNHPGHRDWVRDAMWPKISQWKIFPLLPENRVNSGGCALSHGVRYWVEHMPGVLGAKLWPGGNRPLDKEANTKDSRPQKKRQIAQDIIWVPDPAMPEGAHPRGFSATGAKNLPLSPSQCGFEFYELHPRVAADTVNNLVGVIKMDKNQTL